MSDVKELLKKQITEKAHDYAFGSVKNPNDLSEMDIFGRVGAREGYKAGANNILRDLIEALELIKFNQSEWEAVNQNHKHMTVSQKNRAFLERFKKEENETTKRTRS